MLVERDTAPDPERGGFAVVNTTLYLEEIYLIDR
jgi:hypothetical protein